MEKDIQDYFYQQYAKSTVKVVPGHWPDFQSKEDVDRWIDGLNEMDAFFAHLLRERQEGKR